MKNLKVLNMKISNNYCIYNFLWLFYDFLDFNIFRVWNFLKSFN